jgi:hypothetical protein
MSEQSEQPTIEAPIKRKYTRKPKPVVEPVIEVKSEPVVVEKPKRKYTRKPRMDDAKVVVDSEPESVSSTETVSSESEPTCSLSSVGCPHGKKERTQKQKDAFNRMREARIKKSEELAALKEFKKEKELLEKENTKVQKLEQKIIKKSQPGPKRASSDGPKPRKQPNGVRLLDGQKEETYYSDPDHSNIKVSTHKPILFV